MTQPRVLLIDIETSPITGYTWSTYQDNVLKILEPSKILSVAWKFLGEDDTYCKTLPDYPKYKKGLIEDEALVKEAWGLLDGADVVVAHHGSRFDLPKLNARFVYYDLRAPSAYQVIDTKKVASRYFRFDSNSLNNLGQYLGCGSKVQNGGFDLWVRCIAGDSQAWELMREYNIQDVVLLEKVYLKLRPYITNHPSLPLIAGVSSGTQCPSCSSEKIQKRGFTFTKTGRKQRYQCSECGSWSSGPYEKIKNSNILQTDSE